MMVFITGLCQSTWQLLLEMAPYLLFGFGIAGILKAFLPRDLFNKHLAHGKWRSVIKAAIIGVPLPICSCGVIPLAEHLKKNGARKGAVLSFLASTPTSGIDSLLATYSLLGGLFTFVRLMASLTVGIVAGFTINLIEKEENSVAAPVDEACLCGHKNCHDKSKFHRLKGALTYAFVELIDDVTKWLFIGLLAGGFISYVLPASFVQDYLRESLTSYSLMLLIGIPTYVCSTGSIPIAAALILKGMSPGAGLIFLIAGPATNTATISFVGGRLGKRALTIYLLAIILISVFWALLMDFFWSASDTSMVLMNNKMTMLPYSIKFISAILLLLLLSRSPIVKQYNRLFSKKKKTSCCH